MSIWPSPTKTRSRLWYDSYMNSSAVGAGRLSASGTARAWIEALPAGTWFRSAAVPGKRHVVRNVLSRLMAVERPIIGRVAPSVYWRQPPPRHPRYGKAPILTHSADSVLAPPGSGYAGRNALHRIGWCRQMPYRTTIAIPYRNLTPPPSPSGPPVLFVERHNRRRRELNWNEATLLEAALSSGPADYRGWDHAMSYFDWANGWMKQGAPIRKDAFLWAAEAENPQTKWPAGEGYNSFDSVIGRLAADLPDIVKAP